MDPGMTAQSTPARRFGALRDVFGGIAAIGVKELRGRMRGRRAFVIITIHLLLIAGFAWMIETLMERTFSGGFGSSFSASAEIGRALFIALLMLLTIVVLVLAPASTAGAISLEREKQTLDLLSTTPISSLAIVLGKLASALSWIVLLLLASIPVTALVFTFGGVGPDDMLRGYVVLLVVAIFYGSLGLFVSALVKRTQAATVINLVSLIALTAGTGFIFLFWTSMTASEFGVPRDNGGLAGFTRRPPEALLWFNPFVAQTDVVCGTETGFGGTCQIIGTVTNRDPVFNDNGGGFNDQFGVARDSYWPRALAAMGIASLILIVLSVQLVSPTRRWRIRLPRPRRRPAGSEA
jgi:ABC-type transport system involved in multi-copper enzyme maturation permease subunit